MEWKIISSETVLQLYRGSVEKRRYELPHGKQVDFHIREGEGSVACLALTKEKQVILAKQYRPGPAKVLLEIPGGGLDPGENLAEAAARELLEETGYQGKVQYVASSVPSAYAAYLKHSFIAVDCVKVQEPMVETNGETIEVVLMSLPDFRKHLRSGQLTDVEIGYLGLDYLGLL
jgi:ADP-ribose pyrophosphatase